LQSLNTLEIVFTDCFLTGVVDAPYNDIANLPIASASDCQIKCQANPRCNYFVYRANIQHCWLKTAVGALKIRRYFPYCFDLFLVSGYSFFNLSHNCSILALYKIWRPRLAPKATPSLATALLRPCIYV